MPPIREFSSWTERATDFEDEIEPVRKYIFVCEGGSTEHHYFKSLVEQKNSLGIHPLIGLSYWEKTGIDKDVSNPKALVEFAHRQKELGGANFARGLDYMVIVFDVDIYCRIGDGRKGGEECVRQFRDLLNMRDADDIFAITNPSFELFLLMHKENAYTEIIRPHIDELLENKKDGNRRFAQRLFTDTFEMNPKTNPKVGRLASEVEIAIGEEKNVNQQIESCLDELTSNVGQAIERIQNDTLD